MKKTRAMIAKMSKIGGSPRSQKRQEYNIAWNKQNKTLKDNWKCRNPIAFMLNASKQRAKTNNLEFSLTKEDVARLLEPMLCAMTGLKLSWEWPNDTPNPWRPSIDRLDSSKGYTAANIQITCWIYNQAKGIWPAEELLKMAKALAMSPN